MAGIYIHIPFCRSRCVYCGFYSTTRSTLRQRYVDAVCREMVLRRELWGTERLGSVETVYLGGGTPSQLTMEQLAQLLYNINKVYSMGHSPEVTIECNPDDVTEAFAGQLAQLPVNRVSMGAQTFSNERLHFLRRRHTGEQVVQAVERLRGSGISNISIDLMYGFPGETLDSWQRDIDAALALDVEHLSAYCLMVEEGTELYEIMRNGNGEKVKCCKEGLTECDEELEREMYYTLIDRLTQAGYEHYELSNFARPGFRSRHNSSYWHEVPYVGLGAAAHSYDGECRQWNVENIDDYIGGIEAGKPVVEREQLDGDTCYNECVMTSLRTREGLDLGCLNAQQRTFCLEQARPFIEGGLLVADGQRLALTSKGLFVSNMVMSGLMKA